MLECTRLHLKYETPLVTATCQGGFFYLIVIGMISAKKRFEILKRDWFRCQYCGRNWKDVTLEVDHVLPKSRGGTDDSSNLITCCRECNMGKWKTRLDDSELWKSKMEDLVVKIKKDFNKKWNGAHLGEISKWTYILFCTFVDCYVVWKYSPNSIDVRDEIYACCGCDFAWPRPYPSADERITYWKRLEEEFMKWWEFCDRCCEASYDEILDGFIDNFISEVCDDSYWTWGKCTDKWTADYRFNYILSRELMTAWKDYVDRDDNDYEDESKIPYNCSWLKYLVMKYTYRKDRLDHFANGGE